MTAHGYVAYSKGCRCEACREAKRQYGRAARACARDRRRLVQAGGGRYAARVLTHGYSAYQNNSCRCEVCTSAKAEHDAQRWANRNQP